LLLQELHWSLQFLLAGNLPDQTMAEASDGIERDTVLREDSVTRRIKTISVHFILNNNSLEFLPMSAECSEENV